MKQREIFFSLLTSLTCSSTMLFSNTAAQQPQDHSQPKNTILASALPHLEDGVGLILTGEWLYWKTREEGLTYGLRSPSYTLNTTKSVKGSPHEITPDFNSGFRIGANYELPHDGWDLYSTWTSYGNNNEKSLHNKSGKIIWPTWINANGAPTVTYKLKAKWELDYEVMDIGLGCDFHPRQHLAIRPFAGFRAAWIDQKLRVKNRHVTFLETGASPISISHILSKNTIDFQGYGMRFGFNIDWLLGSGFSFISDASGSILWSQFDLSQFERNSDHTPRSHVEDKIQRLTPVFDLFAGLKWETDFEGDEFYFNLHAGWEQQVWVGQNQLQTFPISTNRGYGDRQEGNLYLYGWTFGASFGF